MVNAQVTSLVRLRLGILLFVLWWLPLYSLSPLIADWLGYSNDSHATRNITILFMIVQTLIGVLGAFLAGSELMRTLKQVRYRKMPAAIWQLTKTGQIELNNSMLKSH